MPNRKRLFLDIETSPMIVTSWTLWPDKLQHDNILEDFQIICAAWKWENKDNMYSARWKVSPEGLSDLPVCIKLADAISRADEIVYHNGDKFDFKKLHARLVYHDLDPLPYPIRIDTLKQAKKHFKFSSNRLDYLGKFLGIDRKIPMSYGLWLKCIKGDKAALKRMVDYCKQDVYLLEEVFYRLEPYIDVPTSYDSSKSCPKCSSSNLQKRGFHRTKVGKYQRFQCNDCGAWCSNRVRLNSKKSTRILR